MSESAPSKIPEPPILHSFASASELAGSLADYVVRAQDEALKKQPKFKMAVSGGSLPKTLQGLIGRGDVQWDKW